jgi:hypothetical protein
MENGYIKLWRKSMDSRIFANASLWQLWTYCLMKANHSEKWVSMSIGKGETEIHIKTGQFIFGRNTWAKKLKIKPSTLWNQMQKLKNLEYLDMQSNNVCTIVTIRNWAIYQQKENEIEQPNGHQVENKLKTNYKQTENNPTQTRMNKNDKNVKNDKNKKKHFDFVYLTDEEFEKLKKKWPQTYNQKIFDLNDYNYTHPKKFKEYGSHYHVILKWNRTAPVEHPDRPIHNEKPMARMKRLESPESKAVLDQMNNLIKDRPANWQLQLKEKQKQLNKIQEDLSTRKVGELIN